MDEIFDIFHPPDIYPGFCRFLYSDTIIPIFDKVNRLMYPIYNHLQ